jgi:hypothetical protein
MRPIYTIILTLLLIGGTYAYIQFAESVRRPPNESFYKTAEGVVSVEIRRSFDCFANPDFEIDAIKVDFKNETIMRIQNDLPATEELVIDSLAGVEEGENEITVFGNSESEDAFLSDEPAPSLRALLVRVLYDDNVVAERQFFAESNETWVGGSVGFKVPDSAAEANHD